MTRELAWQACRNARDLGGLPVRGGGETRFGRVVRSDTLRQLTPAGWRCLVEYGVETVVDLRFPFEIEADAPLAERPGGLSASPVRAAPRANGRPVSLRTIGISLLGDPDPAVAEDFGRIARAERLPAASTRAVYVEMLRRYADRFAAVVAAVADAPGSVLVHCHAGKDRTGLVVALLLGVAGVEEEAIAADYALSGPSLEPSLRPWIEAADDDEDREHRLRVAGAPAEAMLDVLAELDRRYGGAPGYLLATGLGESRLARVRERLVA